MVVNFKSLGNIKVTSPLSYGIIDSDDGTLEFMQGGIPLKVYKCNVHPE